jgi:hypothetical protein
MSGTLAIVPAGMVTVVGAVSSIGLLQGGQLDTIMPAATDNRGQVAAISLGVMAPPPPARLRDHLIPSRGPSVGGVTVD